MSALQKQGVINNENFELIFQGAGDGNDFNEVLNDLKLVTIVTFLESVPFIYALNNMIQADNKTNHCVPPVMNWHSPFFRGFGDG